MSESKPSSRLDPTYDFHKRLKFGSCLERILSLSQREYTKELRLSAWTLRGVLNVRGDTEVKRLRIKVHVLAITTPREKESFVIYRRQILELLRWPKPAFEQLAIELPCLMGFRAREVTTWRAEWIDYVRCDTQVLDAKKHRLFTVPLNSQVAKHAEEVLGARSDGYVLQSRSNAWQRTDRPITPIAVWYIWQKWATTIEIILQEPISPVVGRRFFAAEFYHLQPHSLVELQRIMRHSNPETTLRYVSSLVFYEDVKDAYDRFQLGLMQEAPKGVTT